MEPRFLVRVRVRIRGRGRGRATVRGRVRVRVRVRARVRVGVRVSTPGLPLTLLHLLGNLARMLAPRVLVRRPLVQPRAPDQRVVGERVAVTQRVQLERRHRPDLLCPGRVVPVSGSGRRSSVCHGLRGAGRWLRRGSGHWPRCGRTPWPVAAAGVSKISGPLPERRAGLIVSLISSLKTTSNSISSLVD